MPFYTRDFRDLFGFEHPTIQYLTLNGFIQPFGPPAKGRGSRRSYGLDAAFRIGVLARLRQAGIDVTAGNDYVGFVAAFFTELSQRPIPPNLLPDEYMIHQLLRLYRPFTHAVVPPHRHFFLEVIDKTWATIFWKDRRNDVLTRGPYLTHMYEQVDGRPREQEYSAFALADVSLTLHLTSISTVLQQFIRTHWAQFPEHQKEIEGLHMIEKQQQQAIEQPSSSSTTI